jgi:UDP-MurNAc hydroxylase
MIKINHIDNACCVYEADGFRLLADPWLTNGAFEGSWYHLKDAIKVSLNDLLSVDALYISHLHPDHFDIETLQQFRKDIPIVVLDRAPNFLHRKLNDLGFTNLIKIKDDENERVGPFQLTMYAPFVNHPFDESELGNLLDSAIVLYHDGSLVLNANDNTPTVETAEKLFQQHGPFSVVQLKYSLAGAYPSCFQNLTDKEKLQERERLLARRKKAMDEVAQVLQAKEIQPFAGNYCLAGTLAYKNQFLAVTELDQTRVPQGLPYHYEKDHYPNVNELVELCHKARQRLWEKQKQFNFYKNYKISIYLAYDHYFSFNFNSTDSWTEYSAKAELMYVLDRRLLKRILQRTSHWNNAEIGCHIDFHREPNVYQPDVHTMMSFFHT